MTTYVSANRVPEDVTYFTAGKEYEATYVRPNLYSVVTDDGHPTHICLQGCSHLDNESWNVVER